MPRKKTKDIEDQVCALYMGGLKGTEINELLDLNIKTVYAILHRNNVYVKNYSEARRQYFFNEQYFDNITTSRQAYWLGFIAGDGGIVRNYVVLNLSKKDEALLHQLKNDLQADYPVIIRGNIASLSVASTHMTNSLAQHGIVPAKSKILTMSDKVSDGLMYAYLLGLFDADGCASVDKKRGIRFVQVGSIASMLQFQDVLIDKCQVNRNKLQNHHTTKEIKYLVYSGNLQTKRIFDFLYQNKDFCLERKYNIIKNYFDKLATHKKWNRKSHQPIERIEKFP